MLFEGCDGSCDLDLLFGLLMLLWETPFGLGLLYYLRCLDCWFSFCGLGLLLEILCYRCL